MFKKILIANRGEIALRVIRACAEMGVRSVAIFSEPDRDSLHVKMADEAYCVGPAAPKQSYLNIPSIISVAEVAGVEAIHPGYGFLSENSHFAEVCRANQITFIGPPPEVMEKVGNKAQAREMAMKARVPVIPGSTGVVGTVEEVQTLAAKFGYPVLIKASAGGGGKGMRAVHSADEAAAAFRMAQMEAQSAFGESDVYVEKMIEEPRHVEIQILADSHGNIIYLGERECSVQRRHQKLLEESPSVVLDDRMRREMGEAALRLSKSVGYVSAGTVEFLIDKNRKFYFIEMNARLQVEHPVTEMVTGIDIVKEQIAIAAGEPLSVRQKDVVVRGHAIECRINAEDPLRDFMPSPGDINLYLPPGGPCVRVDSHLYPGYSVLPYYDSLLAKLVVWGKDRTEAIARMRRCLNEFIVTGVSTTIPFHQRLLAHEEFIAGRLSTHFIEQHMNHTVPVEESDDEVLSARG